jgi:ribose-phosphate pyrophosphokinase
MNKIIKYFLLFAVVIGSNSCFAKEYLIFGGNANKELTLEVAKQLRMPEGEAMIDRFNDGEINIKIGCNVRGKDVYVIQSIAKSPNRSINDNLMELYLFIRTLKRASAGNITAIIPYYGYARQDRKLESRVPISASDVAMLLENSGVDRVVAIDLHAGQIQGFFHNVPVDNIYGSIFMAPQIAEMKLTNPVIISPDAGGVSRAKKFRDTLALYGVNADLAIIIKQRSGAGVVDTANLIGDVKGKDAIIIDDICDTGGTLVKAADELKKFGANRIFACITHPVFSKDAISKIEQSSFDQVFVSDSIYIPKGEYKKITTVSIANLLAKVIDRLEQGESLSELFITPKSYVDEYGASKIYKPAAVLEKVKISKGNVKFKEANQKTVWVTSTSQVKLDATQDIFQRKIFNQNKDINVLGFKTNSGVGEQPIGFAVALQGARNRIADLKLQNKEYQATRPYIVSIENFFTAMKDGVNPTDHAVVVIETPDGLEHVFVSVGVGLAPEIYKEAIKTPEVTIGSYLARKYNVNAQDWHGYVTGNKIDRRQQILSALDYKVAS